MKKVCMLAIIVMFFGCVATQQDQVKKVTDPILKLRIEGVDSVKVEPTDNSGKEMEMEEKRLNMELEKWAYEKAEKDRSLLSSRLSTFCNMELTYPTFDLYSTISMSDWRNIQKDFETLSMIGHDTVILRIFSGGGSAFAGMGIADSITEWHNKGLNVIGKAYGMIASATVPIFASCSKRIVAPSTLFMVHEASMFKFLAHETHSDINSQKVMFDMMQQKYCEILSKNSNKTVDFWIDLESKTTWFTAEQAHLWGLVDVIE